jgi:aminopeptidase N
MCGDRELLPTAVQPSHYKLALAPQLEEFVYSGSLTVTLTVQEPCNAITFHARELVISSGEQQAASKASRKRLDTRNRTPTERLKLYLCGP